jgi:hypothetical protein
LRRANRGKLSPYYNDPARFARECVLWPTGETLAAYQAECLTTLAEKRRLALRGPHGLGKSTIAALAVLWFALTRDKLTDWKVVTTAGAWRQLTRYLWPEIAKWSRRLDWSKLVRGPFDIRSELLTLNLKLRTGEAFAVASDDPTMIEGAHASELLYVFDESKGIRAATFDAAEGALSSGNAFALALSTPGEPAGRFYEIHQRKAGFEDWATRHVTREEAIAAGRMNPEWAEKRKRQWGEGSALYQNRVLGDFFADSQQSVIPLSWVELANQRYLEYIDEHGLPDQLTAIGLDVAHGGKAKAVLARRFERILTGIEEVDSSDTMRQAGEVSLLLKKHPLATAIVDVIGVGAGVVDVLREQGLNVIAFNAGSATKHTEADAEVTFANRRSAAWWMMREYLDPANGYEVMLPPHDLLTGDLTTPRHWVSSTGRRVVEPKPEIAKRLGRSTDYGDACVMAFWPGEAVDNRAGAWRNFARVGGEW